jgi:hypothetical protein
MLNSPVYFPVFPSRCLAALFPRMLVVIISIVTSTLGGITKCREGWREIQQYAERSKPQVPSFPQSTNFLPCLQCSKNSQYLKMISYNFKFFNIKDLSLKFEPIHILTYLWS